MIINQKSLRKQDRGNAVWHCLCYKTPRGRRQPLTVKSYHLIELPYCVYKMKQNLHNAAKDKIFPYLRFGLLCGVYFDTKLHQERKLCFHDRKIMALLPLNRKCKTSCGSYGSTSLGLSLFQPL